jgi:hypothetical protein
MLDKSLATTREAKAPLSLENKVLVVGKNLCGENEV